MNPAVHYYGSKSLPYFNLPEKTFRIVNVGLFAIRCSELRSAGLLPIVRWFVTAYQSHFRESRCQRRILENFAIDDWNVTDPKLRLKKPTYAGQQS
jgi:hypothetical protein